MKKVRLIMSDTLKKKKEQRRVLLNRLLKEEKSGHGSVNRAPCIRFLPTECMEEKQLSHQLMRAGFLHHLTQLRLRAERDFSGQ